MSHAQTDHVQQPRDWLAVAAALVPRFTERAADHDASDAFVARNYEDLKAARLFSAGVPTELGGGGATHAELCEVLRTLAGGCASTALSLSMHTHQVAVSTWRWRHEAMPPQVRGTLEAFLRRIAAHELVLASSGGSDWLAGSGQAERVEGGWKVSGRKVFTSGAPGADLLMTCAIAPGADGQAEVLHFPLPLQQEGVRILDTWHTLGMRGTGSHDVQLEGVFVPDAAVGGRRVPGRWNPLFHTIAMLAIPLIYAVYVGVAEAANAAALRLARRRADDPHLPYLVGELENELVSAQLALQGMLAIAAGAQPGPATTSALFVRRTLCARGAIRAVEKALEVGGGAAFYRGAGLERMFRDVQAARYHPLQEKVQLRLTGRLALGLDIDG